MAQKRPCSYQEERVAKLRENTVLVLSCPYLDSVCPEPVLANRSFLVLKWLHKRRFHTHPEVRQRERHVADHRGVARARPLPAGGAVEWQNRAAVVHGEVDVQVLHVERERPQVVRLACRTHLSFTNLSPLFLCLSRACLGKLIVSFLV
eukprot:COSAG06_NODE_12178_length_1412_cov_17.252094_2_plen_149_part_00